MTPIGWRCRIFSTLTHWVQKVEFWCVSVELAVGAFSFCFVYDHLKSHTAGKYVLSVCLFVSLRFLCIFSLLSFFFYLLQMNFIRLKYVRAHGATLLSWKPWTNSHAPKYQPNMFSLFLWNEPPSRLLHFCILIFILGCPLFFFFFFFFPHCVSLDSAPTALSFLFFVCDFRSFSLSK